MRVTPKESNADSAAAAAEPVGHQTAPEAVEKTAPAAEKGGRRSAGEILRASKSKGEDASRNRESAPEGSKAAKPEESESEVASTATAEEAEGQEEDGQGEKPSKSVRRRLRRAKQAAKAEDSVSTEVAALRAQVQLLTELQSGKAPQAASNGKPKAFEPPKFSEVYPKDGTDEEQESWRLRKTVHELAAPLAKQMAEGIVTQNLQQFGELLSPVLEDYVGRHRTSQYERMRPIVEEAGFDFDEVTEDAKALVKQYNNQLPMEAAFGMVMFSGQHDAVEAEQPAPKPNKIPSRAGNRALSSLSGRVAPDQPKGVFGHAWRGRQENVIAILKSRAKTRTAH